DPQFRLYHRLPDVLERVRRLPGGAHLRSEALPGPLLPRATQFPSPLGVPAYVAEARRRRKPIVQRVRQSRGAVVLNHPATIDRPYREPMELVLEPRD